VREALAPIEHLSQKNCKDSELMKEALNSERCNGHTMERTNHNWESASSGEPSEKPHWHIFTTEYSRARDTEKAKEEEKLIEVKKELETLTKRVNDLKNSLFDGRKQYPEGRRMLNSMLRGWHEQILVDILEDVGQLQDKLKNFKIHKESTYIVQLQNILGDLKMHNDLTHIIQLEEILEYLKGNNVLLEEVEKIQDKLKNFKSHKILENIAKSMKKIENDIDNICKFEEEFHKKYFENFIKDNENLMVQYRSLIADLRACIKQFVYDKKIIDEIKHHQNGPDVKSLIERQDFLDNLRDFIAKKRQNNEAFGAEREKIRNTRHAFLDAMMKQASETSSIALSEGFKVDPETGEITLPEEFTVDSAGSKGLFAELCYKLAQMDSYTSVKDSSGHLVFTSEMYKSFRIENLKDGIKTVFDKTPFSPEGLIDKLAENPYLAELYRGDVGVWEGYTLREHTLMVMDRFEQYCVPSWNSSILTKDDFRLLLALHDLGKPQAVKETGGTSAQHEYTLRIVTPEMLKQLGISDAKARVMASIISQNYVGSQMKRHIPLGGLLWKVYSEKDGERISAETRKDAKKISAKAKELGIGTAEYFELLTIYYQCDAASYTKDAPNGKRALDHLFEFTADPVNDQKTMKFSKLAKRAFRILDGFVREEDSERKQQGPGTSDEE
jgi:hypothetical protein